MIENPTIKPYDITNGEKVTYGYYSALEVVFSQFLNKLETYFYDSYNLSFNLSFSIKTDIKYSRYLNSIEQPSPLFIFGMSPLMRDSIVKIDNRFVNLILSREELYKNGKVAIDNRFTLSQENSDRVKNSMEELLELFQESWQGVSQVNCTLKKLVSNKIKAKVMGETESCAVVTIKLQQNKYVSTCEFCMSTYQLDRIMEKRGARGLIAAYGSQPQDSFVRNHLTRVLMEESRYELKAVLGTLKLSHKDIIDSYRKNQIIPLETEIKDYVSLYLNEIPILAATLGTSKSKISLRIDNAFDAAKKQSENRPSSFSEITFKKV